MLCIACKLPVYYMTHLVGWLDLSSSAPLPLPLPWSYDRRSACQSSVWCSRGSAAYHQEAALHRELQVTWGWWREFSLQGLQIQQVWEVLGTQAAQGDCTTCMKWTAQTCSCWAWDNTHDSTHTIHTIANKLFLDVTTHFTEGLGIYSAVSLCCYV